MYQTEKGTLTLIINQTQTEEIPVLKFFQYELIGKWTTGNQCRVSTFLKTLVLSEKNLFWKSLDPDIP